MLVCQALDCISNKKKQTLPCSLGPDGRDADATFSDGQVELLSLDDIPETSQAKVDTRSTQHSAAVTIVPLTPMSLEAPEEGEKEEGPLMSSSGTRAQPWLHGGRGEGTELRRGGRCCRSC
ncbi:PREDICTED: condensin-2 complex subunit H2-like [Ficedula albicollis]|uniref:condensin-2 complex subunit H2-like n=1 Tax=Ficedula albicollis TaxID=59894 RepID=UPI0007AD7F17|nr:PREDICTED: condensin-2 complex subunit H2-like [Ficedula albicollis]